MGLDLKDLKYNTLNSATTDTHTPAGDRRRTPPLRALRTGLEAIFGRRVSIRTPNALVIHAQEIQGAAMYTNRISLLQAQSLAGGGAPGDAQTHSSWEYKVRMNTSDACMPLPTSGTDKVLISEITVYSNLPSPIPIGSLVTVEYENPLNNFNPRIVAHHGSIAVEGLVGSVNSNVRLGTMFGNNPAGLLSPPTGDLTLKQASETSPISEPPDVILHARTLGYETWTEPWRLWIFGIRAPSRTSNKFDDQLGWVYVDDKNQWNIHYWPGTTDPGWKILKQPYPGEPSAKGTAILKPGQYMDTWKIKPHRGNYLALAQRAGKVSVYRDNNRDTVLDLNINQIYTGNYGINIHAAWSGRLGRIIDATNVDGQSAGCQVYKSGAGFESMMQYAFQQVRETGRETFTYTLFDKWGAGQAPPQPTQPPRPEESST